MDVIPLFVGDQPSSKNSDQEVAFIGTRSHEILLTWVEVLGVDRYFMINSHTPELLSEIERRAFLGFKIVALGNNASTRLSKRGIQHFKLPHPSGRNRQLNNLGFIVAQLETCKKYLKEIQVTP